MSSLGLHAFPEVILDTKALKYTLLQFPQTDGLETTSRSNFSHPKQIN